MKKLYLTILIILIAINLYAIDYDFAHGMGNFTGWEVHDANWILSNASVSSYSGTSGFLQTRTGGVGYQPSASAHTVNCYISSGRIANGITMILYSDCDDGKRHWQVYTIDNYNGHTGYALFQSGGNQHYDIPSWDSIEIPHKLTITWDGTNTRLYVNDNPIVRAMAQDYGVASTRGHFFYSYNIASDANTVYWTTVEDEAARPPTGITEIIQ